MATNAAVDVVMPQMGVSVSEGTITKWLKTEGEHVAGERADRPRTGRDIGERTDARVPCGRPYRVGARHRSGAGRGHRPRRPRDEEGHPELHRVGRTDDGPRDRARRVAGADERSATARARTCARSCADPDRDTGAGACAGRAGCSAAACTGRGRTCRRGACNGGPR